MFSNATFCDKDPVKALTSLKKKNTTRMAFGVVHIALSERFHCFGGSGRCLVGGRRDAVSCSHDRVTVSTRVVKRARTDTRVTPPIDSA